MEGFKYYFNTQQKIDSVLGNKDIKSDNISSVLFYLVLYAYYKENKTTKDEIIKYVDWWMKDKKIKSYCLASYAHEISRAIKTVKKIPWRNIETPIPIRKSELDHIASFKEIKAEKLLFCYLAVAKFYDMSREVKTHWENESDAAIFKMARINLPVADRDFFIHDVISNEEKSKVHQSFKDDDTSKRIDFVSDDENDPVVLELNEIDYDELAFNYLNWKNGGGYKRCDGCGRLFRIKTNAQYCKKCSQRYKKKESIIVVCDDCHQKFEVSSKASKTYRCEECQKKADYIPIGTKIIKCIDCGKDFEISSKNTKTTMCKECYKIHRRTRKTEVMRLLREDV